MASKSCVVYVVAWDKNGPTKIGIATSMMHRMIGLQNGCPYRLHIYKAFVVESIGYARDVERRSLKHFGKWALIGEWIGVAPAIVINIVARKIACGGHELTVWVPTGSEAVRRAAQLSNDPAGWARKNGKLRRKRPKGLIQSAKESLAQAAAAKAEYDWWRDN